MVKQFMGLKQFVMGYAGAILGATLLALFVRAFIVEAYRIPTPFMTPALLPGDHIFVGKMSYKRWFFSGEIVIPKRGQIVVFNFPDDLDKDFIKRVIAVPGDTVQINDKVLLVNDKPVTVTPPGAPLPEEGTFPETLEDRQWSVHWDKDSAQPKSLPKITVPAGQIFVLGDNRSKGQDSRNWGFVSAKYLKGRALFIWMSVAKEGVRWNRILKGVQ